MFLLKSSTDNINVVHQLNANDFIYFSESCWTEQGCSLYGVWCNSLLCVVFHITVAESQHLLTATWHTASHTPGACCLLLHLLCTGEAFVVKCLVCTENFGFMSWFDSDIHLLLWHQDREG